MKPEDFYEAWTYANPNIRMTFDPNKFNDEELDEQLRKNAKHNARFESNEEYNSKYYSSARGYGKSRFQSEYEEDKVKWGYKAGGHETYSEYDGKPVDSRIVTNLPDSYIDGGIVLKEGFTLSRVQQLEMSSYQWATLEEWAQSMGNVKVDELVENKLLWIYDVPPVITSMVA